MLYIIIVLGIFILDQIIKKHIENKKELYSKETILEGKIIVTKTYNKGAFLGLFKKNPYILAIVNAISVLGLIIFLIKLLMGKGHHVLKFGIALILGGALSNNYDRFKRKHVIDYFSFGFLKNVVFNLADMFIFLGTFLVFIFNLISKE
jgi:signal peptidase II